MRTLCVITAATLSTVSVAAAADEPVTHSAGLRQMSAEEQAYFTPLLSAVSAAINKAAAAHHRSACEVRPLRGGQNGNDGVPFLESGGSRAAPSWVWNIVVYCSGPELMIAGLSAQPYELAAVQTFGSAHPPVVEHRAGYVVVDDVPNIGVHLQRLAIGAVSESKALAQSRLPDKTVEKLATGPSVVIVTTFNYRQEVPKVPWPGDIKITDMVDITDVQKALATIPLPLPSTPPPEPTTAQGTATERKAAERSIYLQFGGPKYEKDFGIPCDAHACLDSAPPYTFQSTREDYDRKTKTPGKKRCGRYGLSPAGLSNDMSQALIYENGAGGGGCWLLRRAGADWKIVDSSVTHEQ